ncbi:Os03g0291566 [Oryza sativa Japonica Group]|uniref:Os03g0291566 protein n=1 Tax=Oryza sativa subsp. japonica TaxID=39947 RepID=A0A0N7KH30_ORYSJ|nr:Os03g0291566 [Oryza sativa Japonica Group]
MAGASCLVMCVLGLQLENMVLCGKLDFAVPSFGSRTSSPAGDSKGLRRESCEGCGRRRSSVRDKPRASGGGAGHRALRYAHTRRARPDEEHSRRAQRPPPRSLALALTG